LAGGEKTPGGWAIVILPPARISVWVLGLVSVRTRGEWGMTADKGKEKGMSGMDKRKSYIEEIEQGREDRSEWLIMDLCECNGAFKFSTWVLSFACDGSRTFIVYPFVSSCVFEPQF
jgi:hypothetical protein